MSMSRCLSLVVVLTCGCMVEVESFEEPYDPADEEDGSGVETSAVTLSQAISQRSGSWWGDVATPKNNQVWGELLNSIPGRNLTAPYTFNWKCELPRFDGATQTLALSSTSFSLNSSVLKSWSSPTAGSTYSFTLDPTKYPAGWHEIRIRCKGKETVGPETGKVTAITIGLPVQLRGGTSTNQNHSGTNYVDTHGWYDRGVGYTYATILNISEVVGQPLSGTASIKLKARVSGDTVLDHFMLKIDDQIVTLSDGRPAEFHGTTGDRTLQFDTRRYANGTHRLAMHSHGLEDSSSEQPGKQLASQVEVTIRIQN